MSPINPQQLALTKQDVRGIISEILIATASVNIVTTQDYNDASDLLKAIQVKKKEAEARLAKIENPLKEAIAELRDLKAELIKPLDRANLSIRDAMVAYKVEETKRIQEENDRQAVERERLRREVEQKAEAAKTVTITPASNPEHGGLRIQPGAIARAQARVAQKMLDEAMAQAPATPVKAATSTTRTVKTWKLKSLSQLISGIATGIVPIDALVINEAYVNSHFKMDPNKVLSWPGIEAHEDIRVVLK